MVTRYSAQFYNEKCPIGDSVASVELARLGDTALKKITYYFATVIEEFFKGRVLKS